MMHPCIHCVLIQSYSSGKEAGGCHLDVGLSRKVRLIQLNLVNSKSSELKVLFLIISSSNYSEVNINICNP